MRIRIGLILAVLWPIASMATNPPDDQEPLLPGLHVMLIRTNADASETAAVLALRSTAGEEDAFLLPVEQSNPESLFSALGSAHPTVLAEQRLSPSPKANTALEAYIDGEGLLIRTKTTGIQGDRLKVWIGIQVSTAGAGPTKPISRTSFPAEVANGEAFVARVNSKMFVAVTPEPFESAETLLDGMQSAAEQSPLPPPPSTPAIANEPRIIWDTAPGAAVPDEEALKRILQQP